MRRCGGVDVDDCQGVTVIYERTRLNRSVKNVGKLGFLLAKLGVHRCLFHLQGELRTGKRKKGCQSCERCCENRMKRGKRAMREEREERLKLCKLNNQPCETYPKYQK